MDPISAAISAGGSLLGSILGGRSTDKANKMQMALAKHGITYRVRDAQDAGIHPLYAIGAPSISSSFQASDYSGVARAAEHVASSRSSLDNEIKKAQLEQIKAQTRKINSDAVATSVIASKNMADANRVRGIGSPRSVTLAGHEAASADERVHNVVMPFGKKVIPVRGRTSVNTLEDYYGDLVSLPAGVASAVEDLINTYVLGRKYDYVKKRLNRSTGGGSSW